MLNPILVDLDALLLDLDAVLALVHAVHAVIQAAPLYTPRMPRSGKPMSVRMTNCGTLGWVTDEAGYRYQPTHPETGLPWPPIPEIVLHAWHDLAGYAAEPEACLINLYGASARMGLHQDRDEQDFAAPVVSLSLGDTCLFRVGGRKRSEATHQLLEVVKRDRKWNEDGARKQLVQFFEAWGPTDEATVEGRKRLSTILFS